MKMNVTILQRPRLVGTAKFLFSFVLCSFLIQNDAGAQEFWQHTNGPEAGSVLSLATNTSGHIFAGTSDSGIYRSIDNGNNWKQVLSRRTVLALAISSNGYIFAGTEGDGLYRSTDNGNNWQQDTSEVLHPYVLSLTVDLDGDIFVGTQGGGVFRSLSNGDNWTEINNGLRDFFVLALGINQANGDLLAGTIGGGVFLSTNKGNSWSQKITGMSRLQIYSIANGTKGRLFAGTLGGVYRSEDGGDSWTLSANGLPDISIRSLVLNKGGHLFAGTTQGVFRSTDNGNTWIPFNNGLTNLIVLTLVTNAKGLILAGTGSGVFRAVDTELPAIDHNPQIVEPNGQAILVEARIADDTKVTGAKLYYRRGGEANFTFGKMDSTENGYSLKIPTDFVTSLGVEYYIVATDIFDNEAQLPTSGIFSIQVRISGQGEMKHDAPGKPVAQPYGGDQNAYRLFSVPLDVDDKSPETVLEDDLGRYDKKKWRFYELRDDYYKLPAGTSIYTEFPNTGEMTPGKAFWLIVKDSSKVIDTGPAVSNKTDKEYAISLHSGWNFIGNPFNFQLPIEKLRLKSRGKPPILRYFSGEWNNLATNPVAGILPFEGYAVFDSIFPGDTLLVNPNLSVSSFQLFKQTASQREDILFSIQVLAQCQEARDVDNVVTVAASASRNQDSLDQPEPPVIGEYVSVCFPHKEWNTLAKTYCIDARPEPTDGEVWEFEVKTNIRDKVNLTFEGIDEVPKEFEVWLVDDALKITQNLREQQQYAVAGASPVAVAGAVAGAEHVKQLKLVVGKREFVDEKLAEARAIPTTYELSQNFPNPFNPATTIRYGLPKAERVTLKIYNLLGAEVATLVSDEQQAAGYHAAIWDGRDKNGRLVASGVYVYRIRAGSFTSTRKLTLVK
jgi:photosystem II stability/assembly factor-like uncharacterized protein